MPQPYSPDLRLRVLHACGAGTERRAEIARRFEISEATLYLWLQQYRAEGRTAAKPHAGGRARRINAELLRALVAERNDRTLAELAAGYVERTGERVSLASISRLLEQLHLRRKKKGAPRQRAAAPRRGRRAQHVP